MLLFFNFTQRDVVILMLQNLFLFFCLIVIMFCCLLCGRGCTMFFILSALLLPFAMLWMHIVLNKDTSHRVEQSWGQGRINLPGGGPEQKSICWAPYAFFTTKKFDLTIQEKQRWCSQEITMAPSFKCHSKTQECDIEPMLTIQGSWKKRN